MTCPWIQQEGEQLKQMREQARLDAVSFAMENAISLAQLQQLENGGDSCFYTQAIKAQLGRKLIKKLQSHTG